ncbi:MAG: Rieske 2Fe-2S domain-containing protein [Pedobacter sp.]|jgi:3-phenylpropionate/trans-cinnamate dioxygenase ferredoxin subunit|uniref:Rieske (2Fe-2S) protein n=1 Tax=Pedobacter sp. TaxID=1411316 RepID=UPI00356583F1
MNWVKIDIQIPEEDFIEQIKVNGKKFCLIKNQQKIYVVQNTCPHAGGILSGGWCKEGNIVCPIHRWEYNLETGRGAEGQGDYINIYPTKLKEDGLYVGFKESLWKRFFK